MSEAALMAWIGILGNLITLVGVCLQNRSTKKLMEYRLDQVEKKVGVHNGHSDKIAELQSDVRVLTEKLAVANHRIEDLEKAS